MSQGTCEATSSFHCSPCFRAHESEVISFAHTAGSKSAARSKLSLEFSDLDFSQACLSSSAVSTEYQSLQKQRQRHVRS